MGSESDDSDLRERIAELEATVEQQQQTIKRMLPGRRSALKAGGLLAGGGLLGAAGSDQAAAADGTQDTSDGTVRGNGGGVDIRLDELRDPGGDEVFDIDDTGAINAAVSGRRFRFDSISTGTVDIEPPSDGTTKTTSITEFATDRFVAEYAQRTEDVSTSTVEILSTESSNLARGAFCVVEGTLTSDPATIFIDLVLYARNDPVATIASESNLSPASRTYGTDNSDLTLEMGADTYNVHAYAIGSRSG